jgi:hypothetical protein
MGKVSAVGEQAGEDPADVITVRCPDEMNDRRFALPLKLSSCCPSLEMTLFVVETSSIDCSRAASDTEKEASLSRLLKS